MSSTVAPSSMATVYPLLREPSLALFWTHLITPSTYGALLRGYLTPTRISSHRTLRFSS